jgi:hypothetical protein
MHGTGLADRGTGKLLAWVGEMDTMARGRQVMTRLLCLAAAATCLPVGCDSRRPVILDDRQIVQEFCQVAKPVVHDDLVGVSFPDMDSRTMMAAVRLARRCDEQLYGDLGAVILRVHRFESSRASTTSPFPVHQDVPRLFAARFGRGWEFNSDEPLLAQVAEWIQDSTPETLDSALLRREIQGGRE